MNLPPTLPLGVALTGLRSPADGAPMEPRAALTWAASLGFRAVQLDASAPGVRPRELDRSARRDLAALLRRLELNFCGLDLWIPPAHLTEPAHADRAVSAALQAIELAADLSSLARSAGASGGPGGVVSIVLPASAPPDIIDPLLNRAEACRVRLADHAWPPDARWTGQPSAGPVGVGVDPAAVLIAGADPGRAVSGLGSPPASARLSDLSSAGRVAPGAPDGRLDELEYSVALVTSGYSREVVLDLRSLPDQDRAARAVLRRWQRSVGPVSA
jgi:sugar phosphate isomerase/epimerase